ncbi:DUF2167 domain-containing protein [Bradyrhizobium manausense]|uniref:DUF2167 domain-containing protein n=1 Tax=Bradyrhizobium manausense TaxID=989370 RepID=UPI001BA45DC3|nr:DUF2167 domain-containing protein [Bradyrhizobium manausense]MBR1090966.1 DUF2167 domain-containing protein [Bradyrhizobium manausense]
MQKFITAVGAILFVIFGSLPGFSQGAPSSEAERKAELAAAWQAASNAGTAGPADVALIDQATLKLPAGDFFVPKAEGIRVMRALGNTIHDASFVGLVLGTRQNDRWLVVITYIKEGYIKDDAAKDWNADDLLKNLKEGVEESNKDRAARGFPEMEVIGWIEPPNYDATSHRLVWSVLGKDKGTPDDARKDVNYNTYALGRDGYFSLNLLSDSTKVATDKSAAHELLANLTYQSGKRYEDFSASTDRIAEYGLLALVGGVAAKKLGLLALLLAFVLKFAKAIFVAAAVFGTGVLKFFRRKPRDDSAGGPA